MIVARRFLRDRRRSTVWWMLAAVIAIGSTLAIYPSVKGQASFDEIVDDLPDTFRALLGSQADVPISSAPGYLHARLLSTVAPLILLIFGIGLGAAALGGSEDNGTLELLLSNPVSRTRVVLERAAAVLVLMLVLGATVTAATFVFAPAFDALDGVSLVGLVAACAAATVLGLLHAAVAFAVGAFTGRRATAVTAATVLAVAGYLVFGFAATSAALHPARFVTPWHWYLGRNMLVQGVAPDALIVPCVVTVLLLVAAVARFNRRDLRNPV